MFNSYEDLVAAVKERQQDHLVLEVDLGATFSQEHEDAKAELTQAKALKSIAGQEGFLSDNVATLETKVRETEPTSQPIWVRFKRLDLMEWALLMKAQNMSPIEQYEKVLNKTFVGVFNGPEKEATCLTEDPRTLSSSGDLGILSGGSLHNVIQAFMAWQNAGGEVRIHPTKSGQD